MVDYEKKCKKLSNELRATKSDVDFYYELWEQTSNRSRQRSKALELLVPLVDEDDLAELLGELYDLRLDKECVKDE